MNGVAFVPLVNSPGKSDVTGAFLPEAKAFVRKHGGRVVRFNNSAVFRKRAREVLDALANETDLDYVAFFCHGWEGPAGGIQAGFRLSNVAVLARAIAAATHRNPTVPLYCCETASDADRDDEDDNVPGWAGDGGFADLLRDELARAGDAPRVVAHTVTGHTTWLPYVRAFEGAAPAAGGPWLVGPHESIWPKWKRAMRTTDLRLRIPFMTREQILAELA